MPAIVGLKTKKPIEEEKMASQSWLAVQPRCHQHPLTLPPTSHCPTGPACPLPAAALLHIHGLEIPADSEGGATGNTRGWLSFFPRLFLLLSLLGTH